MEEFVRYFNCAFSLSQVLNFFKNFMDKEEVTKISSDGLRYKTKKGGSPFGAGRPADTMSCYKCGLHKLRSLGSFKKIVTRNLFICVDCKNAASK